MLSAAGFDVEAVHGGFGREPFDADESEHVGPGVPGGGGGAGTHTFYIRAFWWRLMVTGAAWGACCATHERALSTSFPLLPHPHIYLADLGDRYRCIDSAQPLSLYALGAVDFCLLWSLRPRLSKRCSGVKLGWRPD
eukprot:scaffold9905_cov117-Isochrysis_galbana.AAC.8